MEADHNSGLIDRRNVLIGAVGATAAATSLIAGNVFAASHGGGMHHEHSKHDMNLIDAATNCVKNGQICSDHCIKLVKADDTSIADCLGTVSELLAACNALAILASYQSSHLPTFVKSCIAICEDCEKECRKHEDKHVECKNCAEACKDCIAACKKVAA